MNQWNQIYIAILVLLTALAIYLAQGASRRGEGMAAFVMLVIALLFWKRVQQRRS